MEKLSFKLPAFEGPLELLLYLISRDKLDIYDVPISELLDQYLAYLAAMDEFDMEVTSEFLEMASRLVQIKSAMLLPKPEEGMAQREELIATLVSYQACKAMAQALARRGEGLNRFVRQPQPVEHRSSCEEGSLNPRELLEAYLLACRRIQSRKPPTAEAFRGVVGKRIVSVGVRVLHVLRRLLREGRQSFGALFEDASSRSEAVATFLAVLELIRSKRVVMEGGRENGEGVETADASVRLRAPWQKGRARRVSVPARQEDSGLEP